MSDHATPAEVATGFITAFGKRDLRAIAGYLAEDVVFESPRVTLTGAAAVREAIGQFAQVVTGVNIMAVLGDDETAPPTAPRHRRTIRCEVPPTHSPPLDQW